MNSAEMLARYEDMLRLSQQMLACARQNEWDRLVALEQARTTISGDLAKSANKNLPKQINPVKLRKLILDILDTDKEIKVLIESWREQLQKILGSLGNEKKLLNFYDIT